MTFAYHVVSMAWRHLHRKNDKRRMILYELITQLGKKSESKSKNLRRKNKTRRGFENSKPKLHSLGRPSDQHGIALLLIPECYKFDSPLSPSVWFLKQPFHRAFLSSACAERRRLLAMIVKGYRVESMGAQCIRVVLVRCLWWVKRRFQEGYLVRIIICSLHEYEIEMIEWCLRDVGDA